MSCGPKADASKLKHRNHDSKRVVRRANCCKHQSCEECEPQQPACSGWGARAESEEGSDLNVIALGRPIRGSYKSDDEHEEAETENDEARDGEPTARNLRAHLPENERNEREQHSEPRKPNDPLPEADFTVAL